MNEQNLDYLNRQIKFTGFGGGYEKALKMQMLSGATEFVLMHELEFGRDLAKATLYFRKAAAVDLYFFNRYDLELKVNGQPGSIKQTFYISPKGDHITFKEGYNLLSGRAVQKEHRPRDGEMYKVWLQINFKETDPNGQYKIRQFHPNYGFDLEAILKKYPIQELHTVEENIRLVESLERGNRQKVSYLGEPGSVQSVFIEASPQFKTIHFYDESMRRILLAGQQKLAEPDHSRQPIEQEYIISNAQEKKESAGLPPVKRGKVKAPGGKAKRV